MKKSVFLISRRLMAIIVVLTILATGTSFAQEKESQDTAAVKLKSESLAVVYSLIGTMVPWSMALSGVGGGWFTLGGFIIGPSLGYFYGGINGRGLRGIGVRSLCFLSIFGGAVLGWNDDTPLAYGLFFGGLAGCIISSIWDIASVGRAVRKRNEELKTIAFSIAPIIIPQKKTYGIGVQVQF